jgi:sugar phosphate isomerase/epimerase
VKVHFFCPRWGSEGMGWEVFCSRVKSAGYDGVEFAIPATVMERELDEAWNAFSRNRLLVIPQHYDTVSADFSEHFEAYHSWLERIARFPYLKINSQTGRDFFSFSENTRLIELGNAFDVLHETHRGKFSFAAHVTQAFLADIPLLRLTLDLSHWVCVSESLLEDQWEAVGMAIERTGHIHARIGYPEGPQVSDPRIPEWKKVLERYLGWWDGVMAKSDGMTITPEFGPYPYMVHLPWSGEPIASQWEVNCWMMELLRKRYS